MAITTDYETWYDTADIEDQDENGDLLQSLERVAQVGSFKTSQHNATQYLVHSEAVEEDLLLKTEKARLAFIRFVESKFEDLPDEIDLAYERAIHDPHT